MLNFDKNFHDVKTHDRWTTGLAYNHFLRQQC